MTTIAYCLLAHKNPKQVCRLIRNIYCPSDFYYVNIFGNTSTKETWKKEFREFEGNNFFVAFEHGDSWAAFPVVAATLSSMRKFACFNYDYFVNLTGQCYPLKSIDSIKRFLQAKNFAYMEYTKLPSSDWKNGGLDRFEYSYYKNPFITLAEIILKKILKSSKIELRKFRFIKLHRINRQIPYKLEPYGGSAYFCFTKKHVDYLLEYITGKPNLIHFFNHTFAPDEMFFQSIIMNSALKDAVVNDNLRYIDWSQKSGAHPALLTINDADKLLNSAKLFARKFDIESDEMILDLIDYQKKN